MSMSHDSNALDCLFGPYDFLDTAQPSPMAANHEMMQPGGMDQQRSAGLNMAQPYRGMVPSNRPPPPPPQRGGPTQHAVPQHRQDMFHGPPPHGGSGHQQMTTQHDGSGGPQHGGPPGGYGGHSAHDPMGTQIHGLGNHGHHGLQQHRASYGSGPQHAQHQMGPPVGSVPSRGLAPPHPDEPAAKRGRVGGGPVGNPGVAPQGMGPPGPGNGMGPQDVDLQDKADRCRARNREHARQTRRRKKEFVENLQSSVQELGRENELMAARLATLDQTSADRARRAEVVQKVLALRVEPQDEPNVHKSWARYVEPDFELRLPHTPYRSFAAYEATAQGRVVSGVAAAVADVKSLRVCLNTLRRRARAARALASKKLSLVQLGSGLSSAERSSQSSSRRNAGADEDPTALTASDGVSTHAAMSSSEEDATSTSTGRALTGGQHHQSSDEEGASGQSRGGRSDPSSRGMSSDAASSSNSDSDQCGTDGDIECALERSAIAWTEDGAMLAPWVLRVCDDKGDVLLHHRGFLRATFRAAPAQFAESVTGAADITTTHATSNADRNASAQPDVHSAADVDRQPQPADDDDDDADDSAPPLDAMCLSGTGADMLHKAEPAPSTSGGSSNEDTENANSPPPGAPRQLKVGPDGKATAVAAPRARPGAVQRIATLELVHDTVAFWQQLQGGLRSDALYKTVPNTLDAALEPSDEARVVTTATRPFVIEHVNGAWTKLCGYDPEECLGKTLAILQGPETDLKEVSKLTHDAERGHAASALLTNYNKQGAKFRNFVRVFPLVDDQDGSTKVTHMLGVLQDVVG